MKRTTYQVPELRDENDNIIQEGTFGKHSAFSNSTNDGAFDYILNDLEALHDNIMGGTGGEINTETITGKTGTITNLTATTVKTGTVTADAMNGPLTGDVTGNLNGNVTGDVTGNLTGNVTGTADKAVADGNGNNIANTYVTKSGLASSVTTTTGKVTTLTATDSTFTNVTINGETSVPTANAGNSSKAIANTEFVAKSISALVNGAPDQLNTLNELAKALGNDSNFASTVTAELANISTGLTQAETRISTAETRISAAVPTGVVQAFAGNTLPNGWLLCDGSAVSRTDYAALYAVIGTTYGAGNGSTTFNLPNLVDKFVEGSATAGTVKSAGLPNITGSIGGGSGSGGPAGNGSGIGFLRDTMINGCFRPNDKAYGNETGLGGGRIPSGYPVMTANLDASRSSAIYGKSTTVQPPALTMRYIIKY